MYGNLGKIEHRPRVESTCLVSRSALSYRWSLVQIRPPAPPECPPGRFQSPAIQNSSGVSVTVVQCFEESSALARGHERAIGHAKTFSARWPVPAAPRISAPSHRFYDAPENAAVVCSAARSQIEVG
jgi:hypothetical protein